MFIENIFQKLNQIHIEWGGGHWCQDEFEPATILLEMEQPSEQHVEGLHQTSQPTTLHRCHHLRGGEKY